jgi:hypothetical protein
MEETGRPDGRLADGGSTMILVGNRKLTPPDMRVRIRRFRKSLLRCLRSGIVKGDPKGLPRTAFACPLLVRLDFASLRLDGD